MIKYLYMETPLINEQFYPSLHLSSSKYAGTITDKSVLGGSCMLGNAHFSPFTGEWKYFSLSYLPR